MKPMMRKDIDIWLDLISPVSGSQISKASFMSDGLPNLVGDSLFLIRFVYLEVV